MLGGKRMKIYLVRHCSTQYSEEKIYCGSTDAPLSACGEAEAEHLAKISDHYNFDFILSSPLLRARVTANALARSRNIPIFYDDRLRERDFGDFEGTSCARADGRRFRYSFALKYPNGESNLEVAARIYSLLDELRTRDAENILLVSHGSACRIIRSYFVEMTDEEFYAYSQPNGSIVEYEFR